MTSYSECCHRNALDPEAAFCEECGTTLLRCIAYSECYGLVEPLTPCRVCISADLMVESGAVTRAMVGQQLTIPLVLRHTANVQRPLWVSKVLVRRGYEPVRELELPWDRLDPGQERVFYVDTGALEGGGTGMIAVALSLGTRHQGYEEAYLYGAAIQFTVDAERASHISPNIDLSNSQFDTGGLVNIPIEIKGGTLVESAQGTADRIRMPFERYERLELTNRIRGYRDPGHRMPRLVVFRFRGFPEEHAQAGSVRIGAKGALVFGRNGRIFDAQHNPENSDVALRIVDPATGEQDDGLSYGISRRHFDLLVLRERLYVHVRSSNGLVVNGKTIPTATLHQLHDGDAIAPLVNRPDALAMRMRFLAQPDGQIETIEISREPAVPATPATTMP